MTVKPPTVDAHAHDHDHDHDHDHGPGHRDGHGHSHGLVHASIKRSREGLRAVLITLVVLLLTSLAQGAIFVATGSVALLADLIHNFGDALTAVPLAVAFLMRSFIAEKVAGYFVVAAIFISACVALAESVNRLVNPQHLSHLGALAAAGLIGFMGNEIAAWIRLRAGRRLQSPALIADGYHARADGFISLAVIASAAMVALGVPIADPIIGIVVTLAILRITWHSFQTVRTDPGEPIGLGDDTVAVRSDSSEHGHDHDHDHTHR